MLWSFAYSKKSESMIVDTDLKQHVALVQPSFPNLIIIHAIRPCRHAY